jgi:tRNA (cytidine/uridine-2'-O-)-methyltransferase
MDYRERATYTLHDDWETCIAALGNGRRFAITTRGTTPYHQVRFAPGDALVFGPETRGLPAAILESFSNENCLRIPMITESRSLNLANAAAVVTYEAWRQCGFPIPAEPSSVQ